MKKIAYLALAFVMGIFNSCTDKEEIGIIQHKDLVLNINTSSAYESWGMTNYQNFLGNNSNYNIGVTTLVYDNKGNLRDSQFSILKTFQTISHTIKGLEEGTYSIIVFETMVDANNGNKSDCWTLEKTELLDSVRVVNSDRLSVGWYDAFGFIASTATVGKDEELNLNPKGIGCIVNLQYENFEKSGYNYFDLAVKNSADGYFLKPGLNESERYFYNKYLESKTWHSLAYFYSKDKLPNSNSLAYYTFETGRITCMFGAAKTMWIDGNTSYDYASDNFTFNFETGKLYQAYCYYKGKPDVFNSFLGLSSDFASWYSKLDKTMNPIYEEPCTSWGETVSYVKSLMRNYELYQDLSEYTNGYSMAYYGRYSEDLVEYDFQTKSSGLFNSCIYISESQASMDDILAYLNGNSTYEYDKYYEEEGFGYHLYTSDKTYVAVFAGAYDDGTPYTMVQYLSRAYSDGQGSNARTRSSILKSMIKKYGNSYIK